MSSLAPGTPTAHTGHAFMPGLHGLRGLAAVAVLMFHWSSYFPQHNGWLAQWQWPGHPWINPTLPFALGWQGVYLFFVLSGFLLTLQWQSRPLTYRHYTRYVGRRALRIFPGYWLQLAVLLGVAAVWAGSFKLPEGMDLFNHLLLWLNLPPHFSAPMNGVWWTLPVELMFYAILPLVVWLAQRWGWGWTALTTLLLCWAWRGGVMNHYPGPDMAPRMTVIDALPGVLGVFMAGVWMAHAHQRWPLLHSRPATAVALVVLLLLETLLVRYVELYWHKGPLLLMWPSACALAMAVVVAGMARQPVRWLVHPFMHWLGERSYGLYLWHLPVMVLLSQSSLAHAPGVLVWGLMVLATGLLAEISYRLVENRAMNWGRQHA